MKIADKFVDVMKRLSTCIKKEIAQRKVYGVREYISIVIRSLICAKKETQPEIQLSSSLIISLNIFMVSGNHGFHGKTDISVPNKEFSTLKRVKLSVFHQISQC